MQNDRRSFLSIPLLMLLPSIAYANAGTPLMWATMLHLTFGNAIIGIIEGLLLALVFHVSKRKAVGLLILANYISAWLGGLILRGHIAANIDMTIENIRTWLWGLIFIAFLITLIIEFPFILLALNKTKNLIKKSIIASLLVQSASYIFLVAWYLMASGTTMSTELDVVAPSKMQIPAQYSLYYISQDGRSILKSDLTGNNVEKIKDVQAIDKYDRLFAKSTDKNIYDLSLCLNTDRTNQEQLILNDFAVLASVDPNDSMRTHPKNTWQNFGKVPKLNVDTDWEYHAGFWAVEGIYGTNKKTDSHFHYSIEMPFAYWPVRNAVHIEGDFVVFQLGDNQICILNPQTKKVALITKGKGPIVAVTKTAL